MTHAYARALLAGVALTAATQLIAQTRPTVEQFFNVASPLALASARNADRIAWTTYERGQRNVFTAAAPLFKPLRITNFLEDDGTAVGELSLSDDGTIAVFVRGTRPNRDGWVANPTHDPQGAEQAIWAAHTSGAGAWRLAAGGAPRLSPNGRAVLYVKDGQIYRVRVNRQVVPDSMDRGLKPYIKQWGAQSNPVWSPDGARIAFVSSRGDHSFIGIYDVATRKVVYVAPSVDCDAAPTWSPDGKRIAFVRRPGTPFGLQTQTATPGIGNPAGPNAGRQGGCTTAFGVARITPPDTARTDTRPAGLYKGAFADGATIRVLVADVAKLNADIASEATREIWHNNASDSTFAAINRMIWAFDQLLLPLSPMRDEWDRYYALSTSQPNAQPVLLTTTDGLIEDATSATVSRDGIMLYYSTNANDIERRHIWAVPVSGGTPVQVTTGSGVETSPQALASGRQLAVLYFGAKQPASVAVMSTNGGAQKVIYPTLPKDFLAHVVPEIVVVNSPDSLPIHSQLFLPADMKPGEKRPAIVFVHGGPVRQMLPAYHYMEFYHWAYGFNQWLASQGYIVMSVNYRLGIGYGRSFQLAKNGGGRGNSEYQDVLAAGRYLQARPDVDPARVGIWGLSYGGVLTAQALARNSDVFAAGIDLAGVHLWGSSLDTASVSYKASAIAEVRNWKSPVLLVHGDDDRNVTFAQTVGLVQLLRANNVYHELIIIPDDTHESLLHSRWIYTWNRMGDFLKKHLWDRTVATQ